MDDKQFDKIVSQAIDAIPPLYQKHLQNVAFITEDDPSPEQLYKLRLFRGELLFGLYEGVPLPQRQGTTKLLPDKITIFKNPALMVSRSLDELREHIRHTVWHEVAHYYGLDHDRIHQLENKRRGV
ncbi:MAG TPA: metallopeptidase family protein [Candidatus Saccharimonadales bacterium]|nr:metallopeptidase family protein [Candidatus Saccharimonadales bacterium]